MALNRLSPSRSKKEFLDHIGLSEDVEEDRRVYRDMMDEANHARERMCTNLDNLTPAARSNPSLRPPFSSNMISEAAQYKEICNIWHRASPATMNMYLKGSYYEGPHWDNWVIRWCVWHAFRYRDERNRNRTQRPAPLVSVSRDGSSDDDQMPMSPSTYYDYIRGTTYVGGRG